MVTDHKQPNESQIQGSILDYLSARHVFHYRNNTGAFVRPGSNSFYRFGVKGAPDIVCVIKGRYVAIECKSKKGRQSESQRDFQEQLEDAGGLYLLVSSLEEAIIQLKPHI